MALFGTGIMKGPFAIDKEYANWNDGGDYDPRFKTVPQVDMCRCGTSIQTQTQTIWTKHST